MQFEANVTAAQEYVDPQTPVIFTDGAINIMPSAYVVRVYWGRTEANLVTANGPELGRPILQTIMPLHTFIQTAAFFDNMVKRFLKSGLVTEDQVKEIAKTAGAQ